jgi:hypothetical protein
MDPTSPLYPLAKFGLAQAIESRDAIQSHKLYQEFLTDWKDADRDLPAVARAEHALQSAQ